MKIKIATLDDWVKISKSVDDISSNDGNSSIDSLFTGFCFIQTAVLYTDCSEPQDDYSSPFDFSEDYSQNSIQISNQKHEAAIHTEQNQTSGLVEKTPSNTNNPGMNTSKRKRPDHIKIKENKRPRVGQMSMAAFVKKKEHIRRPLKETVHHNLNLNSISKKCTKLASLSFAKTERSTPENHSSGKYFRKKK